MDTKRATERNTSKTDRVLQDSNQTQCSKSLEYKCQIFFLPYYKFRGKKRDFSKTLSSFVREILIERVFRAWASLDLKIHFAGLFSRGVYLCMLVTRKNAIRTMEFIIHVTEFCTLSINGKSTNLFCAAARFA